jgi:cytochrome o ubiquinol oxidase subunit 2
MSSFWVPQLGGQVYAMTGMGTELNLKAGKLGEYRGVSANINGKGFADMKFTVKAVTDEQFDEWVHAAQGANRPLTTEAYTKLSHPGTQEKPSYYSSAGTELYDTIMMKYMMPSGETETSEASH